MNARLRTSALALVAVGALALAGCSTGSAATPSGSASGEAPAAEATSVETMFGTVDIPAPADGELTVVALGWSDAEMALALGVAPVAVSDWQGFGAESKGVGPWATDLFGDVTPELIERGDQALNYEQIQALEPDLILNTRSSNDEAEFERLSEIAPTVYGPEGAASFATEWRDQLTLVGEALGEADAAASLIADVEGQIADAAAANPEFEGLTVASAAKFDAAYGAYLPGDGRFDLLGELGFVNNPAIADLEALGFYASVSAENVTALDADVAVVVPIGFTLAETEADPLLQSLPVVSEGRTVFIDPASELSGAWSASSVLSIPYVLDELVPQLAEAAAAE